MKQKTLEKLIAKIKEEPDYKEINEEYSIANPRQGNLDDTYLQFPNEKEAINYYKKRYFYFAIDYETSKVQRYVMKEFLEKYNLNDKLDIIIAVERKSIVATEKEATQSGFNYKGEGQIESLMKKIQEDIKGNDPVKNIKNFYKTDFINAAPTNSYFLVAIKTPKYSAQNGDATLVDGGDGFYYDVTNLKNYLLISDSRTYKDIVYLEPVFSNASSEKQPEIKAVEWRHNMLIHGAPGTGKSFMVNEKALGNPKAEDEEKKKGSFLPSNVRRVTFYEDYSYEKFVGAYMPVQKNKTTSIVFGEQNGETRGDGISYEFRPGIMADMIVNAYAKLYGVYSNAQEKPHDKQQKEISELLDALKDKPLDVQLYEFYKAKVAEYERYLLIIEEINRAPAASVFGDMFQLLDRDSSGISTYSISLSEEFREWFVNKFIAVCNSTTGNYDVNFLKKHRTFAECIADNLRLPPNLYIWATMNSADQGVFPLDSAFKRRWTYLYKSVSSECGIMREMYIDKDKCVNWDHLRVAINKAIIAAGCTEEDRLLGTWYFSDNDLSDITSFVQAEGDRSAMINPVCDKLFAYLRNDVFRNNPEAFFKITTMSEIREELVSDDGKNLIQKISEIIKDFKPDSIEIIDKNTTQPNTQSSEPETDEAQATAEGGNS